MTYTEEQKAEALAAYLEVGSAEAGRRLGIPSRTIRHWVTQRALAQVRREKTEVAIAQLVLLQEHMREELRTRLLEKGLDALDRMDQVHVDYRGKDSVRVEWEVAPAAAFKDYAVAMAVLLDKYRLEMGEATQRVEESGADDIERSIRQLVDEMARRAPTQVPEGAMGGSAKT